MDGFNLYYGALKGSPYKWLDIKALFKRILRPTNDIQAIRYYIARVSARPENPDAPTRQDAYLRALAAYIPELSITFGGFVQKPVSMRLVTPEKRYDCAVVCSNDGDLAEALRIVRKELRKTVILAVPGDASVRPPSNQLRRWASYTMQIPTAVLAECQLPNPIPGTTIHKPAVW